MYGNLVLHKSVRLFWGSVPALPPSSSFPSAPIKDQGQGHGLLRLAQTGGDFGCAADYLSEDTPRVSEEDGSLSKDASAACSDDGAAVVGGADNGEEGEAPPDCADAAAAAAGGGANVGVTGLTKKKDRQAAGW